MRKLFILLTVFLVFACSQSEDPTPEESPPEAPFVVRDSAWNEIPASKLYAVLFSRQSREDEAPTEAEAKAAIAEYNAAHTDDQWFFLEEDIPIEQADDAEAWIARDSNMAIYWHGTVSRADLEERREEWRASVEVMADPETLIIVPCTLYVDNLPPEPPVVEPVTPKLWTSIFDLTDQISFYTELAADEAAANFRYYALTLQLEQIKNGNDADHPADHDYIIYRGDHEPTLADFPGAI